MNEGKLPKKRLNREQLSVETVCEALKQAGGNASAAARILKVTRQTIVNYEKRHPEVAAARKEAREVFIDMAEAKLVKLVNDEHPPAVFFVLRTLGKDRGYAERKEVTGSDGGPIEVANTGNVLSKLEQLVLEAESKAKEE